MIDQNAWTLKSVSGIRGSYRPALEASGLAVFFGSISTADSVRLIRLFGLCRGIKECALPSRKNLPIGPTC